MKWNELPERAKKNNDNQMKRYEILVRSGNTQNATQTPSKEKLGRTKERKCNEQTEEKNAHFL